MMQNKSFNPFGIIPFGTQAVVLQGNFLGHTVKQPEAVVPRDCSNGGFEMFIQRPSKTCQVIEENDNSLLHNPHDEFLSVN